MPCHADTTSTSQSIQHGDKYVSPLSLKAADFGSCRPAEHPLVNPWQPLVYPWTTQEVVHQPAAPSVPVLESKKTASVSVIVRREDFLDEKTAPPDLPAAKSVLCQPAELPLRDLRVSQEVAHQLAVTSAPVLENRELLSVSVVDSSEASHVEKLVPPVLQAGQVPLPQHQDEHECEKMLDKSGVSEGVVSFAPGCEGLLPDPGPDVVGPQFRGFELPSWKWHPKLSACEILSMFQNVKSECQGTALPLFGAVARQSVLFEF